MEKLHLNNKNEKLKYKLLKNIKEINELNIKEYSFQ